MESEWLMATVWIDEQVLQMDSGDNIVNVFDTPWIVYLKMVKKVNLLYKFYIVKKKVETHCIRHDQFIWKIQICLAMYIQGQFGIIISLEAITFSRANWPRGSN